MRFLKYHLPPFYKCKMTILTLTGYVIHISNKWILKTLKKKKQNSLFSLSPFFNIFSYLFFMIMQFFICKYSKLIFIYIFSFYDYDRVGYDFFVYFE